MIDLFEMSALVVSLIPITIGLVGVINTLGINKKYSPIISILISIGLVAMTGVSWQYFIAQGIIVGLSASGLYSGVRKVIE